MSSNFFQFVFRASLAPLVLAMFLNFGASLALGQTNPLDDEPQRVPSRPPATKAPAKAKDSSTKASEKQPQATGASKTGKQDVPAPENVVLATSDSVKLTATYFAPPAADGEQAQAIPFILLHEWEGDRTQLLKYGAFLQKAGHAAIVPDLRGHGESTAVEGVTKQIDVKKFRRSEVQSAQRDIERCKKYLVQRNNEGEVNIDMLTVVAVGETSVLAVEWVINDWVAFPAYNGAGIKQGQDVKMLILISPRKKLKGLSIAANWKHPLISGARGNGLPLMIIWGASDKDAAKDSESLFKLVEKSRPDPEEIEDDDKRKEATTLIGVPVRKNSSTGVLMMSEPTVKGLWAYTAKFVTEKIEAQADKLIWKSRKKSGN